jgi:nicotinamidase-related amidase
MPRRTRTLRGARFHVSVRTTSGDSRHFDEELPHVAIDLREFVDPGHTALVTVEVQTGVVGEHAVLPELARAADAILPKIAALARSARAAGVPVIHCTATPRADGLGANHNARLWGAVRKRPGQARPDATVHDAVGVDPGDLVMPRLHGLSPMTSTSLDPVLRNMGVTTIVATGVSVNIAVMGFAFEAVNLGYQLVIPRDAVAGVDPAYVDAVFEGTLSLIATVTTTEILLGMWEPDAATPHHSQEGTQ